MKHNVVALFVDSDGIYPRLLGASACWDEKRDARKYAGPHPVIAHPPCQLWGNFAFVNYKRWGGEHNKPGNDGGCFQHALWCVETFGGVLEHPKTSRAWKAFGIEKPSPNGWSKTRRGGWVCEVWQSAYGHRANKATYLYFVGGMPTLKMDWSRPVGSHQCGFHDQRGPEKNKKTVGKKEASATPEAFARILIELVRCSSHASPTTRNDETQSTTK